MTANPSKYINYVLRRIISRHVLHFFILAYIRISTPTVQHTRCSTRYPSNPFTQKEEEKKKKNKEKKRREKKAKKRIPGQEAMGFLFFSSQIYP